MMRRSVGFALAIHEQSWPELDEPGVDIMSALEAEFGPRRGAALPPSGTFGVEDLSGEYAPHEGASLSEIGRELGVTRQAAAVALLKAQASFRRKWRKLEHR